MSTAISYYILVILILLSECQNSNKYPNKLNDCCSPIVIILSVLMARIALDICICFPIINLLTSTLIMIKFGLASQIPKLIRKCMDKLDLHYIASYILLSFIYTLVLSYLNLKSIYFIYPNKHIDIMGFS